MFFQKISFCLQLKMILSLKIESFRENKYTVNQGVFVVAALVICLIIIRFHFPKRKSIARNILIFSINTGSNTYIDFITYLHHAS